MGSAAVFLAAAGQRTERVELGTAVIPIGWESPFRLAEDLALADVLSRGRLQVGFSTGLPHAELLGDLVYDGDWRAFDLSYGRAARVLENLRGDYLGGPDTVIHSPGNSQRPRLQPHDPGLVDRTWYGGARLRSTRWAAEQGMNLLTGNVARSATTWVCRTSISGLSVQTATLMTEMIFKGGVSRGIAATELNTVAVCTEQVPPCGDGTSLGVPLCAGIAIVGRCH